ncbi:NAD(P)-binding protein [Amniculicola lignicola CBS 123094]|uniref:D-xylose 1-dehydrogenase (NADP(+), D-xylono-1,5-lactone-forming) n=1 Tax=Amniculicola lignicola CBS 123094 TaxID=1392246 RepID=A0A6A5X2R2_9PLEO|nr:NAD(P)-binding protein [Amniculicola lignicola CBS 123094]
MSSQPFTLKWGILATGGIAKTFTKDLLIDPSTRNVTDIRHEVVAAASSSSTSRAQDFLTDVGAPSSAKAYGSYANLAADKNVDIIYIATPHSHHYQNARLCLEAGKHVLCEKPFTVNAEQTKILIDIARKRKLFLMEAVWTRFFPLAREVMQFVGEGRLGEVKRVWADLSFWNDVEKEFGTGHRMVNLDLAGGALLDLGVYSLTWVFQILYHLQPLPRTPPIVSSTMTKYAPTGCDSQTTVLLTFPSSGAHAIASTSLHISSVPSPSHPSATPAPVRIQGTLGELTIASPIYRPTSYTLIPASNAKRGKLADFEYATKEFEVEGGGHGMFYEADECARCVRDGKGESEVCPLEESLEVMRVMDGVRGAGALVYPGGLESVEFPLEV